MDIVKYANIGKGSDMSNTSKAVKAIFGMEPPPAPDVSTVPTPSAGDAFARAARPRRPSHEAIFGPEAEPTRKPTTLAEAIFGVTPE